MESLLKYLSVAFVVLVAVALLLGIANGVAAKMRKRKEKTDTKKDASKGEEKWYSQYTKYSWTIGLVLAGAAIFYWELYTPGLRPRQVGSWSWEHWLWILAFLGIAIALIKLNEKALGTLAKTMESAAVAAPLVLFLGFPVWFGIVDAFLPTRVCKDGNMSGNTVCNLNTAWSTKFRAAEGRAADGANLCYSPSSLVEHDYIVVNGTSFYSLRSKEGEIEAKYIFKKLPPDGKCPEL